MFFAEKCCVLITTAGISDAVQQVRIFENTDDMHEWLSREKTNINQKVETGTAYDIVRILAKQWLKLYELTKGENHKISSNYGEYFSLFKQYMEKEYTNLFKKAEDEEEKEWGKPQDVCRNAFLDEDEE